MFRTSNLPSQTNLVPGRQMMLTLRSIQECPVITDTYSVSDIAAIIVRVGNEVAVQRYPGDIYL